MTREEACHLLELPPQAPLSERQAPGEELRHRFEDKLAEAPMPGLREKHRSVLRELAACVMQRTGQ